MYEIKELLTDLGLQCSPELITKLGSKYDVFKKDQINPLEYVAEFVCYKNGIKIQELKLKSRKRHLVHARREFMYLLYILGYSMVSIASFLNFDHSTVIVHIQDVESKFSIMPKNKKYFMEKYENIINNNLIKDFAQCAGSMYRYIYNY